MPAAFRLFLLGLLCAGSLAAGVPPWAKLQVGMSPRQAASLLGEPLFRRQGRGFEMWTYDHGAEVLIYGGGAVVGWTAPAPARLPAPSSDVWSLQPAGRYYATLYSLLENSGLAPARSAGPKAQPKPAPAAAGTGYEQFFRGEKG